MWREHSQDLGLQLLVGDVRKIHKVFTVFWQGAQDGARTGPASSGGAGALCVLTGSTSCSASGPRGWTSVSGAACWRSSCVSGAVAAPTLIGAMFRTCAISFAAFPAKGASANGDGAG